MFDVLEIPCCHALAAVGINNVDMYTLVGKSLFVGVWRKLWKENFMSPPKEKDTDVPTSCNTVETNAPKTKKRSGRPRTVRIPSQGEQPVSV